MTTIDQEKTVQTVRLCGFDDDIIKAHVHCRIFEVLLDLAWPVITHYRSDLYHDATWLNEYVTEPTTFYFAVDRWGTSIGTERDFVKHRCVCDEAVLYRLVLTREEREWFLTITTLGKGPQS